MLHLKKTIYIYVLLTSAYLRFFLVNGKKSRIFGFLQF